MLLVVIELIELTKHLPSNVGEGLRTEERKHLMKGIPLMQREDTEVTRALLKRAMNLSVKFVPNILEGITEAQLEYFEKNLPELKFAAQWALAFADNHTPVSQSAVHKALHPPAELDAKSQIVPLALLPVPSDATEEVRWKLGWINFYRKFMGVDVSAELEQFAWPDEGPHGFDWFVFCPKGLTTQMAIDLLCKPQFTTSVYIDLDAYTLDRTPDQSSLVLCRKTVEPDKQWLNNSGKHLDIKGLTRCPGSRRGDNVASAYWRSGKFEVNSNARSRRYSDCGGREAVVLPLKPSS